MTLRSDLLCHYEQILKKELERRETSYNDEKCVQAVEIKRVL